MDRLRFGETHTRMEKTLWISLLGVLLCSGVVNSYSKYGRSCKDIGCKSNEVCTMAEDPCTFDARDKCGRYPTCTRNDGVLGSMSCTTLICQSGQYCKTVNGHPKCVDTVGTLGYDSAGISSVNGHRANTDSNQNHGTSQTNYNPYSSANAPPPETSHDSNYPPLNSGNNGYPQYPPSGNPSYPGYPRPPSSGTNLGYPPYPTQDRMPQPGHYPNYPAYPSNQPGHQYPNNGYQNPYNTHSRGYGAAASTSPQIISLCLAGALLLTVTGYLA